MPLDGDQLDLIQREVFQRQRRTDRPSPPTAHRAGASSRRLRVTAIYSDDRQLRAFAEQQGLTVFGLADLTLPPQPELPLPPPSEPSARQC
jgi:hypothetical protein